MNAIEYVWFFVFILFFFSQAITSSIEMREKGLGNYLRLRYYSQCLNKTGPLIETNKCDGLKVGKTVKFEIEIELLACPPDRKDWNHRFYIYPVGISENVTVDVEMQCDCNCQYPGHPVSEEGLRLVRSKEGNLG